ncbi:hypothetical protein AAMO2058_000593800 [Amorphochlora amoebiformis]
MGLAIDKNDYLYISDGYDNRIRIVNPEGEVRTLAGPVFHKDEMEPKPIRHPSDSTQNVPSIPWCGDPGTEDGYARKARFNAPTGLTIDGQGSLIICDTGNDRVRRLNRLHDFKYRYESGAETDSEAI